MSKILLTVLLTLLVTTTSFAHDSIDHNKATKADESRMAIMLSKNERDIVLTEMRLFLQSIQQITGGISKEDMELVTRAARESGRNAQAAMPASLPPKLPMAFKKLGADTHVKFDELALDAEQLGDPGHALAQLNTILENCVSCHATFRFELEPKAAN